MRALMRRTRGATVAVASLALIATACGSDEATSGDGTDQTTTDGGDMADLSGEVPIAGSSTVGPITLLVSEDFAADHPDVSAPVQITGTGGGFKEHFCVGETAINNASRQIKDSELELCADNGITAEDIVELKVAIDGMTVMTSQDNDSGIECLNFHEIYALVGPESGDVAKWSDANALVAELGGGHNDSLPEVDLSTAGPGTESGTYDSFWELAIEGLGEERGQEEKFRPDWTGNNDDNVIIQGIAGNSYSFGWVGFAYFTEVSDQVQAFDIEDADGNCVAPTPDTIASGEYPLARDLYIYVNLQQLDDVLEAYVDFYLSDHGYDLVAEAGYVQLTADAWAETQAAWAAATA